MRTKKVLSSLSLFFLLFFLAIFWRHTADSSPINGEEEKELALPLIDSPGKTIGSDFNGDGIHDFIVGAYGNNDGPGANNAGAAYVFFGASNLSGTKTAGTDQNVEFVGKAAADRLGRAVGGGRSNPGL